MTQEAADTIALYVFGGLVLSFALLEWVRPYKRVNRRRELLVDLLGFALGLPIVVDVAVRAIVGDGMNLVAPLKAIVAPLPFPVRFLLGIITSDFLLYWWHRLLHTRHLWRVHLLHHSTEDLYWLSGNRASYLHNLSLGLFLVVPTYVFYGSPLELLYLVCFQLFAQLWMHANIKVPLGRLDLVVVTPAYHRVHHRKAHTDGKNLGIMFTVWDRLFGTHVDPRTIPEPVETGVRERYSLLRSLVGF